MKKDFVLATRGSKLALIQAGMVVEMLSQATPDVTFEIKTVKTLGDRLPPEKRGETDGKGAFTGDIESMLLGGEVDLAVHSMKDLSVELRPGLKLGAAPPRGDPSDALVSAGGRKLRELPAGASVGTSSIRRKAQLLNLRKDLKIVDLHGNVETRVRKMEQQELDGIVLAAAGLDRMSLDARIAERFRPDTVVPAACQGTLAVEIREGDTEVERIVSKINDADSMRAAVCERSFARAVGGDCYVPVGAFARPERAILVLTGLIASPDGRKLVKRTLRGSDPEELGEKLGDEMMKAGGAAIIRSLAA